MSTRGFQQALARIYTDARMREAFLAGNEEALLVYDLSPDDLRRLQELREKDAERLEFFSGLLVNKQGNLIRTLLPLTFGAFGESFWGQAWSTYVSTVSNEAIMSPAARAIHFLDFLETYLEQSPANTLKKDIILYERCKLSVRSALQTGHSSQFVVPFSANELKDLYPLVQKPFLIRPFNYDLTEVITTPNISACLHAPKPTPTLILFYRHRQIGNINTAKVAPWTEDLLNLCNGRTTAISVLEWLGKQLGVSAKESSSVCAQLLYLLERQGVLGFLDQSTSASAGGRP